MEKKVTAGVGVLILKNDTILLGKRHKNVSHNKEKLPGKEFWTMPGGSLAFGETFEQAALREVKEETNLDIKNPQVICINNDKSATVHFVTIGLVCEYITGEPLLMEPDKFTDWQWFALDNLPENLFSASKKIIECYQEKKMYMKE